MLGQLDGAEVNSRRLSSRVVLTVSRSHLHYAENSIAFQEAI